MADVFISYKSERRSAAAHLAEILTLHGYSIWYDYQLVKGKNFAFQIDQEIRAAKAVIVLWCSRSVSSEWVHEEADLASELDTLIPVMIEQCR
jgi:TIR domain